MTRVTKEALRKINRATAIAKLIEVTGDLADFGCEIVVFVRDNDESTGDSFAHISNNGSGCEWTPDMATRREDVLKAFKEWASNLE